MRTTNNTIEYRQGFRHLLAMVLLLTVPLDPALAERVKAGKVIYAHGTIWAADESKQGRVLKKGDTVYSGDTIITKSKSMTHMRMVDKGYVSVRANSQFRIKEFKLGKNKDEDVGFFELLKGGFRAVTGIIGKRKKSSYRVNTSIATIGIRGTDYTARLCNDDCGSSIGTSGERGPVIENGLYVGVLDGGVVLANRLGQLELQRLHYGFVKDAASAPRALLDAPKFLFFKTSSPKIRDDDDDEEATPDKKVEIQARKALAPRSDDALSSERQSADVGTVSGELDQEDIDSQISYTKETSDGESLNDPSGQAVQAVAVGVGPLAGEQSFSDVNDNTEASLALDADGFVEGFDASHPDGTVSQYGIGTAQNVDLGLDPTTGIRWGRWANGVASVSGQDINLNNRSLHWVAGPSVIENIALPSSGTASYDLVGNTSPTDNHGNTGILGSASLDANFNSMTVNSSVNVGIDNHVWSGGSTNMPIDASGKYGGAMSVDVDSGAINGSGSTSGFFTNNAAGSGMTYSMDADVNGTPTSVSGAAVFERK